jgi:hypothetical protein
MSDFWWGLPLVLALLIGALCPLTGTLLLVQRRLFQANLISHAVLPGLALAVALRLDPGFGGVVTGVAGALLAYPLYWNTAQARPDTCETVLSRIAETRDLLQRDGTLERLRSGWTRRQLRKLRVLYDVVWGKR